MAGHSVEATPRQAGFYLVRRENIVLVESGVIELPD